MDCEQKQDTTYQVRGRADAYNRIAKLFQDGKISKIVADVANELISIETPCGFWEYTNSLTLITSNGAMVSIFSDGSLCVEITSVGPGEKIREFSKFDELWKEGYGLSNSGDMADLLITHCRNQYAPRLLTGLPSGTLSPGYVKHALNLSRIWGILRLSSVMQHLRF